jgi:uncharacterized membrane protein YheB (UPF0754 family)
MTEHTQDEHALDSSIEELSISEEPIDPTVSTEAVEMAKDKTQSYAKALWSLINDHTKSTREQPEAKLTEPKRFTMENAWILNVLLAVPYFLVGLFLFSFFWDFEGLHWAFWGLQIDMEGLFRILSVSGLIGFMTNWLAITMLFRPAVKRPILGHGLIPAQKDRIAWRLSQAVATDLINPEIIKRKIHESNAIGKYREQATEVIRKVIDAPTFRTELKRLVVEYVDEMVADPTIRTAIATRILQQIESAVESKTVERFALRLYTYLRGQEAQELIDEALLELPHTIENGLDKLDDLLDNIPKKIDEHSDAIENLVTNILFKLVNQLDVQKLVQDNIQQFEERRLEKMIKGATNEQLNYIQYLGAVLGTIGGFVIWEPLISIIVLGSITGSILLLDHLLFTWNQTSQNKDLPG